MPPRNHYLAGSAFYTVLNWNAEEGESSAFHVQFSRVFSASISDVIISFCAIRKIFDRLLERVVYPGDSGQHSKISQDISQNIFKTAIKITQNIL